MNRRKFLGLIGVTASTPIIGGMLKEKEIEFPKAQDGYGDITHAVVSNSMQPAYVGLFINEDTDNDNFVEPKLGKYKRQQVYMGFDGNSEYSNVNDVEFETDEVIKVYGVVLFNENGHPLYYEKIGRDEFDFEYSEEYAKDYVTGRSFKAYPIMVGADDKLKFSAGNITLRIN